MGGLGLEVIVLCFMAIFLDSFTKATKALQGSGFFGGARKGSVKGSAITKFGIDPSRIVVPLLLALRMKGKRALLGDKGMALHRYNSLFVWLYIITTGFRV